MATENTARDPTAQADLLGAEIGRLAAEITVGEHRLITAIGDFDAIDGWARQGALTYGQWLSWKIGVDPHTAREKIRVAKRLRELPQIDAAFAEGKLSYSKVRPSHPESPRGRWIRRCCSSRAWTTCRSSMRSVPARTWRGRGD